MADTVAVHDALLAYLAGDAALMALCPDGVWWAVPPQHARAAVVVFQQDHTDRPGIDSTTLFERTEYTVKAMLRMADGVIPPEGAAARIDALLHHVDLDLSAAGYVAMVCRRIEHFAPATVVDPANLARWRQEGGRYELFAHPTT